MRPSHGATNQRADLVFDQLRAAMVGKAGGKSPGPSLPTAANRARASGVSPGETGCLAACALAGQISFRFAPNILPSNVSSTLFMTPRSNHLLPRRSKSSRHWVKGLRPI
jgi:hypothetical protein